MSTVANGAAIPVQCIWRTGVFRTTRCPVDQELHARHTYVVAGACSHRHDAAYGRIVLGRCDRHRWWCRVSRIGYVHGDGRGSGGIADEVPRPGPQGMSTVANGAAIPVQCIWRTGVFRTTRCPVDQELHAPHSHVVAGVCSHRHDAAYGRIVLGRCDRHRWWCGVSRRIARSDAESCRQHDRECCMKTCEGGLWNNGSEPERRPRTVDRGEEPGQVFGTEFVGVCTGGRGGVRPCRSTPALHSLLRTA